MGLHGSITLDGVVLRTWHKPIGNRREVTKTVTTGSDLLIATSILKQATAHTGFIDRYNIVIIVIHG